MSNMLHFKLEPISPNASFTSTSNGALRVFNPLTMQDDENSSIPVTHHGDTKIVKLEERKDGSNGLVPTTQPIDRTNRGYSPISIDGADERGASNGRREQDRGGRADGGKSVNAKCPSTSENKTYTSFVPPFQRENCGGHSNTRIPSLYSNLARCVPRNYSHDRSAGPLTSANRYSTASGRPPPAGAVQNIQVRMSRPGHRINRYPIFMVHSYVSVCGAFPPFPPPRFDPPPAFPIPPPPPRMSTHPINQCRIRVATPWADGMPVRSDRPGGNDRSGNHFGFQSGSSVPLGSGNQRCVNSGNNHSDSEYEEIMAANRAASSSAITRAVAEATAGDFESAIERIEIVLSLIRRSKVAHDDRCKVLIWSLEDTVCGIEANWHRRTKRMRRSLTRSRSRDNPLEENQ